MVHSQMESYGFVTSLSFSSLVSSRDTTHPSHSFQVSQHPLPLLSRALPMLSHGFGRFFLQSPCQANYLPSHRSPSSVLPGSCHLPPPRHCLFNCRSPSLLVAEERFISIRFFTEPSAFGRLSDTRCALCLLNKKNKQRNTHGVRKLKLFQ